MGVSAYKQGCFACVYRATISFSVASSNCQRGDSVGCCPNASGSPERLGCPLLHMLYLTVNSSVAGMATICKRGSSQSTQRLSGMFFVSGLSPDDGFRV